MSANLLPHIAERVFNTPLLIHPGKLDAILFGLQSRLGVPASSPEPWMFTSDAGEPKMPGYWVLDGGVARIDVFGVLSHHGRVQANSSYVLGYQDIARRLEAAAADDAVQRRVLVFETPGGEASGVFDLADYVRSQRDSEKPIDAILADYAFSAGYLIAAAARRVYITQSGQSGSIGVVFRHVDMSGALEKEGLKVTQLYTGKRKVDGNPFGPLEKEAQAKYEASIWQLHNMFVDSVAASRGISAKVLNDTESDIFNAEQSIQLGLVDELATPDNVIELLRSEIKAGAQRQSPRETSMSTEAKPQGDVQATAPAPVTISAEAHAAAIAKARTDERERCGLIVGCEEAGTRAEMAAYLAFETDMSAEQAVKMLGKAPTAQSQAAAQSGTGFEQAMDALGNPDVGAGAPGADADSPQAIQSLWAVALGTRQ